ncbi:hypothetical protein ACLOJK_022581 [Asimina triloba]
MSCSDRPSKLLKSSVSLSRTDPAKVQSNSTRAATPSSAKIFTVQRLMPKIVPKAFSPQVINPDPLC